jgi:hypothetical protein
MLVKGVTIQDLHFGHKNTEKMYAELSQFKDFIKNNEVHIININGDYFDRKLVGTEPSMFYAVNFFSELVDICKDKNIKLRALQGTRSHELNQLTTMFQHYLNDPELDFKIILTVETERIMGLNVLYVPEEYPDNVAEYYKEYKQGNYNIMHGHGTWDFAAFDNQIEDSEKTGVHVAPVFMYPDWQESIKNGFAIFGHIHKRQHYKNVYYSGSFTRWGYGDRSDKGFTYYEVDSDTGKWVFKYIDNTQAPRYDVASVKDIFSGKDLEKLTFEEIKAALDEVINNSENIRIDLAGLSEEKVKVFRKSLQENPNVKVEVREKKTELLKENTEPAMYTKYEYILQRQLPIDETVKRFIKEEYDTEISIEKIREILTK